MILRQRLKSVSLQGLFFLAITTAFGVFAAYGLVTHLAGGRMWLLDVDEVGEGLTWTATKLLIFVGALLYGLALWSRTPPAAGLRRFPRFAVACLLLLLELVAFQVIELVAPLSLAFAWHVETVSLILAMLVPGALFRALARGERWWLLKEGT